MLSGHSNAAEILINGQENVASLANAEHVFCGSDIHENLDRAKERESDAKSAVIMIEALHECVISLEALLTSVESSDVVESITTLKLMRNFGIQPATDSLGNALQLVTQPTQKPEVVTTAMDMFATLYLTHVRFCVE